ncbi:MAG TPA: hypothetical protein VF263_13385 [Longimicrobiaceae bacterium]
MTTAGLKTSILALALLLAPAAAAAQEPAAPDTSVAAGRRDGRAAAGGRGTGTYAVAGLAGGVLAGVFGPEAVFGPDPTAGVAAVGGLGTVTIAASQGGGGEIRLPPGAEGRIRERGARYALAFRAAYAARVRERRRTASLRAGALGAALGAVGWLVLR